MINQDDLQEKQQNLQEATKVKPRKSFDLRGFTIFQRFKMDLNQRPPD